MPGNLVFCARMSRERAPGTPDSAQWHDRNLDFLHTICWNKLSFGNVIEWGVFYWVVCIIILWIVQQWKSDVSNEALVFLHPKIKYSHHFKRIKVSWEHLPVHVFISSCTVWSKNECTVGKSKLSPSKSISATCIDVRNIADWIILSMGVLFFSFSEQITSERPASLLGGLLSFSVIICNWHL